MTLRVNSLIIVGEKLCKSSLGDSTTNLLLLTYNTADNPKFSTNLTSYLRNATIMEEIFRLIPNFGKK